MNINKFRQAAKANSKIVVEYFETGNARWGDITFWGDIKGKDLPRDLLVTKIYDILGCCVVGSLPNPTYTGADGYMYDSSGNIIEVESKFAAIDPSMIHVGARGGLYWSSNVKKKHNVCSLRSHLSGKFDARMTKATMDGKRRRTYLVCFDRELNSVIDAWYMEPDDIHSELHRRKGNKTITIKLNRFLDIGHAAACTVPVVDFDSWETMQEVNARKAGRMRLSKNFV